MGNLKRKHVVFDTEIIGTNKPVFLICVKVVETGVKQAFWLHKHGHMAQLKAMIDDPQYIWISFNGNHFDMPLIAAALCGHTADTIKLLAGKIINERMKPWDVHRVVQMKDVECDHIDLIYVAPGVMTSLKTYAGRMHYPSMVDLPFHFDKDLTPKECVILESYCMNDLGVTEQLFHRLRGAIDLRYGLSRTYEIDLRSKSDAQAAEAILKKKAGIKRKNAHRPTEVRYTAPAIIKTKNETLCELITALEGWPFQINEKNGAPVEPLWLAENPLGFNGGIYKFGLGGLHSQHDVRFYCEATDDYMISDFDVKSYYPNIMMRCGYVPTLAGGKGLDFLEAYAELYEQRLTAQRGGMKQIAQSLKIALNGTFGKLGSHYSAFYSPELLLAVTITGQLNLLCVIDQLTKNKGIEVLSANTDGIMVGYPKSKRDAVLKAIAANSKTTGFEWEETHYRKVAMKDVNNYIAITTDDEVKAKGLYAEAGLMKNPTMQVCSDAATKFLLTNGKTKPEAFIKRARNMKDFVSIRNVKGGAIQGKEELGRVVRWYMSTQPQEDILTISDGSRVAKTEGGRVCLKLPETLPADLDMNWYVTESYQILYDIGAYAG